MSQNWSDYWMVRHVNLTFLANFSQGQDCCSHRGCWAIIWQKKMRCLCGKWTEELAFFGLISPKSNGRRPRILVVGNILECASSKCKLGTIERKFLKLIDSSTLLLSLDFCSKTALSCEWLHAQCKFLWVLFPPKYVCICWLTDETLNNNLFVLRN